MRLCAQHTPQTGNVRGFGIREPHNHIHEPGQIRITQRDIQSNP